MYFRKLKEGKWFPIANVAEFNTLKAYGTIYSGLEKGQTEADRQIGGYAGPGQYLLLKYWDSHWDADYNEVLTEAQAVDETRRELQALLDLLPLTHKVQLAYELEERFGV